MIGKPVGIKVVALAMFLIGCGISAIVLYGITHRDLVASWSDTDLLGMADRIAVILPLEAAVAFLLSGGIWAMQDWARRGAILGSLYVLAKTAFQLARPVPGGPAFVSQSTLNYLVAIEFIVLLSIVIYLQLPSVSSNFKNDPE